MEGIEGDYLEDIIQIQKIIDKSENFVFLTGAGISRESGIPTFRDKDGLWKKYDPAKLASHSALFQTQNWYGISFTHDKDLYVKLNVMMLILLLGDLKIQGPKIVML